MTATHHAHHRRITPGMRPDNTPDDNDRIEIGPTRLAYDEWAAAGLECPDLPAMRLHRLKRIRESLAARDLAAVLLTDPLNIRYAADAPNMQLWNTHNPFRACLVTADGHMAVWEYKGLAYLTSYNPLVKEVLNGASLFYFSTGDAAEAAAERFAGAVESLIRQHAGSNRRIAVDKMMRHGFQALEAIGLEIHDGEEVMEKTRAVKGPDEIRALRCAQHACEAALAEMRRQTAPGMTENDVWAVLHAENIRRGGEWIETRLLSSGLRTNPWFQECGPRVIGENEILAWDTDLVGCYGMCVDISRTWFIGEGEPTAEMIATHQEAYRQITENWMMLKPGMTLKEVSHATRPMPAEFNALKYGCVMHGVGLCDEWPTVKYPDDWADDEFDYALEPGMLLCSEAYLGRVGGGFGVKLEDQVLITEDGVENLTRCPFDVKLMGGLKDPLGR
ncbi:aminopeptidase P family protein [Pikeienuella piscinae]|uniref:Aminopeptidase P family protein n=2 Tax=Pikeienuella piscinae TaxID=2748098 RepID=A0A7M3T6X6_9RHOB|nr:dimethylsulfonioproprionate lyase DddP [Pikeienuella piscinae]QIE57757.1 aminopeptidase P family protein [Pikeienuella piscinae]